MGFDRLDVVGSAEAHPDHRPLDAVLVHQLERRRDVIDVLGEVRDFLEHVLGRELVVLGLLAELRLEELVPVSLVARRYAEHEVDDADIGGHGHAVRLEHVLFRGQRSQ